MAARSRRRCTHARYDPIANAKAYSQNIAMCDIDASGEYKLLVAGTNRKLLVYGGTQLVSDHYLLEEPVAVCVYYTDSRQPHTPAVADRSGPHGGDAVWGGTKPRESLS